MTEEYKENVLKYLTNNLLDQTGTQEPIYRNITAEDSGLYDSIHSHYQSIVIYIDFIPSKDNQTTKYSVLAVNGQLIGQSDSSGALAILDEEYNVVDLITEYSDGQLIGTIQCINVDENGNYYLVEKTGNNYKIVLLNNITLKPVNSNVYKAIKVATYTLNPSYTISNVCKVFKNTNSDQYFVVLEDSNSYIRAIHLTVGDPNVWKYWVSQIGDIDTGHKMFSNGYNVYWDNDGILQFQIAAYNDGLIILTKSSTSTMNSTKYVGHQPRDEDDYFNNFDFVFYTNKIGLYVESDVSEYVSGYYDFPFRIYKVDLENNKTTLLFANEDIAGGNNPNFQIWFLKKGNRVFYYEYGLIHANNQYAALVGIIDVENNKVYDARHYGVLGTFTESVWLYSWLYPNVIDNFNNVIVKFANQTKLFTANISWNPDTYTGLPYESIGSLVPQYATIEDENEIELFDRNLYNLTTYSNGYNATIQIPNNYLNSVQLANANLYSQNNNLLVGNPINTTKNQYEEVFVNFINRFNILNENEFNIEASSGLVNAMLTKSATGHLGKIKINYNDNTSEIKVLATSDLVYTQLSSGAKTTLKMAVYTSKLIDNIELISEDETISYSTIDCGDMELNKYYLITQDVRID